jgi:alpha-glucosidase
MRDDGAIELDLPAPAIFDTDDPQVTPANPRSGRVRLRPQQAMLLARRES